MSGDEVVSRLSSTVCRSEESAFQRQTENDKPQTTFPRAFLADFGLAKAVATGSKLTRTGEALGTPAYMSPEQARGEVSALTPATDVWSLGCVLYEMLAERAAFEGETAAAVIAQVLTREPPRLRSVRGDVPEAVETVVRMCLANRPRERFREASALRDDLDRVLDGERPRARLPGARRPLAVVAAGLLGLVTVGMVLAWPEGPGAASRYAGIRAQSEAELLASRAHALRASRPAEAAELLRRAIALEPRRDRWRLERGLLLWAVGDGREAVAEWRQVSDASTEAPVARLYEGLEEFFRMEGGGRPRALERVARSPGGPGRIARAALKAIERDWPAAREEVGGVPGWEASLIRGYVEGWDPAGDSAVELREYADAIEGGIPFSWVWNNKGVTRRAQGDLAGALEDFRRALGINPDNVDAWNNVGTVLAGQGDLDGALAAYERVLSLNPRLAGVWNNQAIVRGEQGDPAGAIADFERSLTIEPRDPGTWLNLGRTRASQGDSAAAIRDLGKALELDPRLADGWLARGVARRDSGDPTGAIADFGKALEIDPRLARAFCHRGVAKSDLGDFPGALGDFERALQIEQRLPEALANRGNLRMLRGDLAGAIEDFAKAIECSPPDWKDRPLAEERLASTREALARRAGGR